MQCRKHVVDDLMAGYIHRHGLEASRVVNPTGGLPYTRHCQHNNTPLFMQFSGSCTLCLELCVQLEIVYCTLVSTLLFCDLAYASAGQRCRFVVLCVLCLESKRRQLRYTKVVVHTLCICLCIWL